MNDLIRALIIMSNYAKPRHPTHCENNVLTVNINPSLVSEEDRQTLKELGFHADYIDDDFKSFRFGRC